jgi:hypothetical protein
VNAFNTDQIQVFQNTVTFSRVDYRITAVVKTGAVNGVKSIPSTFGLLPERFLPTVWELIPYSFVADYFINVGDIISSYAFHRENIAFGWTTYKAVTERSFSDMLWRPIYPLYDAVYPAVRRINYIDAWGGGAKTFSKTVTRDHISNDTLMPDLIIHLPFSNKPWVNIGALLTQKFCSL